MREDARIPICGLEQGRAGTIAVDHAVDIMRIRDP